MKQNGDIMMLGGGKVLNLRGPSGAELPATPNVAELFYLTEESPGFPIGYYEHDGTEWKLFGKTLSKNFGGYRETHEIMSDTMIDPNTTNIKRKVITEETDFTIAEVDTNFSYNFILFLEGAHLYSVNWPANTQWVGQPPTLTSKVVIIGNTIPGTQNWILSFVGSYS